MSLTAIFDIGKTNKKVYLFDRYLNVLFQDEVQIDQISDDDGFPCDDLGRITNWMNETLAVLIKQGFIIDKVNFSAYGASLVSLEENGDVVTPFYNYLKPYPPKIKRMFDEKWGDSEWSRQTASPKLYMLNSGLQLFWLKYHKPDLFKRIKTTLHLPQYFHYYFTGSASTEYTSIGCHTGLWDFNKMDYHRWVYEERFHILFPDIISSGTTKPAYIHGRKMDIGVGIHDSSSALFPYILMDENPFLLISTGTWSITLNPFNRDPLTDRELESDCLLYLQPSGSQVRAARLFLGNEHHIQVNCLNAAFNKEKDQYRQIRFKEDFYLKWRDLRKSFFRLESIHQKDPPPASDMGVFGSFEEAYHRMIFELVKCQLKAVHLSRGNSQTSRLYMDGGFADNDVFVQILSRELSTYDIMLCEASPGSALGAAVVLGDAAVNKESLRAHFRIRRVDRE